MMSAIADTIAARTSAILERDLQTLHARTDRIFLWLMLAQWIGGIIAALVIAPTTWIGAQSMVHFHVWIAIGLGGAIASMPIALALRHPGAPVTRYVIAAAQVLFSALLIHMTGGRIETHFHVFGSLAFLAIYRDLRVLGIATAIVALDHLIRGVYWPQSVFGTIAAGNWRWLEHAAWVAFEDLVLVLSIRQGLREMRLNAEREAQLERNVERTEQLVVERTHDLDHALRRAESANRAKTDFLANMSHEIRTPMTAILGFADLLGTDHTDANARHDAVRTIRRNGEHLLSIINDILDISKLEAGRIDVERIECAPHELIDQVITLLRVRAEAKGIALRLDGDSELPVRIVSDPTRFMQILTNLIGNAIKFTETGAVNVAMRVDRATERLVITIRDSGIGIAKEHIDELFQPFQQSDSSMTRRFGGTGLGLAISRELARQLGGDVTVESRPGIGSTFTMSVATGSLSNVPFVSMRDASRAATEHVASGRSVPSDGSALAEVRVLIAEDGPDNQRLIAHVLRRAGAEVTIVDNGERAVETAMEAAHASRAFDVILMDMQMPVLDGYGAVSALRERAYRGPVIALTAHAMTGDRERCLDAGCDDFASKPIDRAALVCTVMKWAARRSSGTTA